MKMAFQNGGLIELRFAFCDFELIGYGDFLFERPITIAKGTWLQFDTTDEQP